MRCIKGAAMVITLLLLSFCAELKAEKQTVFYYSQGCIEAQKHIAALRIGKARQLLAAEKKVSANNAAVVLLESFADYYQIATSQDFSLFKEMEHQKDARLKALEAIPPSTAYRLYAQSEFHLQYAFLKALNSEYVGAMLEFRNAYQLAAENQKKFPAFKPSLKTVGMFKALLGTTPDNYKWILSVAGLSGNFDEGMSMLQQYVDGEIPAEQLLDKQSAELYYTLFQLNFGDKQKAWEFCNTRTGDHASNLISTYLRAYTASKVARNDEAIRVLEGRPRSAEYEPFYILDYYHGSARLNRLDEDADQYLKRFVSFYKGKYLVKDAYRRLGWFYTLRNDEAKAGIYRSLAKRYGSGNNEEERNAAREREKGITTDVVILKARLLFDGGYYQQAEETIKQRTPDQLKTDYQRLEYHYRFARILHEQHKLSKATEYYNYVIKNSAPGTPYYFAPNACLQMGYIYQKLGFNQIARSHFNNVSNYSKAEYIDSIKVKAQKELARLK